MSTCLSSMLTCIFVHVNMVILHVDMLVHVNMVILHVDMYTFVHVNMVILHVDMYTILDIHVVGDVHVIILIAAC